jgi:Cdc6-like AAA superfamily ATPase
MGRYWRLVGSTHHGRSVGKQRPGEYPEVFNWLELDIQSSIGKECEVNWSMRSTQERIQEIDDLVLAVPEDREVLSALAEELDCIERSCKPENFAILGDTFSGKTTTRDKVVMELIRRGFFPTDRRILRGTAIHADVVAAADRDPGPSARRFVALDANSSGQTKAFLNEFLAVLGETVLTASSTGSIETHVRDIIYSQHVEVILIDEAHHLVMHKGAKVSWNVTELLKNITNGVNVLIICFGLPETVQLLQLNAQLRMRGPLVIKLNPYDWNDETSRSQFKRYLHEFDKRLPFDRLSDLDENFLAFRIYQATSGSKGLAARMLKAAARIALRSEADHVELSHLNEAYKKYAAMRGSHVNPFGNAVPATWVPYEAGYWQRHEPVGA